MSTDTAEPSTDRPVSLKPCPICGKAPDDSYLPFCSKRCADRDLHRWLADGYGIPVQSAGADDLPSLDEEVGT